jgi:hypothetical protein
MKLFLFLFSIPFGKEAEDSSMNNLKKMHTQKKKIHTRGKDTKRKVAHILNGRLRFELDFLVISMPSLGAVTNFTI